MSGGKVDPFPSIPKRLNDRARDLFLLEIGDPLAILVRLNNEGVVLLDPIILSTLWLLVRIDHFVVELSRVGCIGFQ